MLYDFALTPDLFSKTVHKDDEALLISLKEVLRGLIVNGVIADLHKSRWSREVTERSRELPQERRDQIMQLLITLKDRNRIIRYPKSSLGEPKHDLDWLSLAVETDLFGIICSNELEDQRVYRDKRLLTLNTILDSDLWESRDTSFTVSTSEGGYRKHLEPILRYASTVDLIDPYISYEPKYLKVVEMCAEFLGNHKGDSRGRIYIHAKNHAALRDDKVQSWFAAWKANLEVLAERYGHRFRVFLWETPTEGERFHDRFILTNQCGISIPAGLAILNGATTDWSLLNYKVSEKRRGQYNDVQTSPFKHICKEPLEIGFSRSRCVS